MCKELFPDYHDRRTSERNCNNVYVQDKEVLERKCICGDHWKTVSVHQVDRFVELARECEAWQKIIRRLVVRKQAQKAKITNDMKIHLEFRHESQCNKLRVYVNLQSSISNLRKPAFSATCAVSVFYANWAI
ncbi:hypothetical protein T01_11351 [Trichinella spiralis]|uniref:Uncharacterized protein n=1 Tax=Trichinella spiralis TaxID=6334 RepID=A0A0V1AP51_TRISP|nr:hypothetical protein T01_11351 [Trichinella spiralis]